MYTLGHPGAKPGWFGHTRAGTRVPPGYIRGKVPGYPQKTYSGRYAGTPRGCIRVGTRVPPEDVYSRRYPGTPREHIRYTGRNPGTSREHTQVGTWVPPQHILGQVPRYPLLILVNAWSMLGKSRWMWPAVEALLTLWGPGDGGEGF